MIEATGAKAHYRTVFTNGAASADADTTADKGGSGEGFRPHELLEAALAACVNMTVRMYADHHELPLAAVTTRVELDRGNPDEAVFRYSVHVEGNLTGDQRERLLQVASACPVRKTLSRAIRFETAAGN